MFQQVIPLIKSSSLSAIVAFGVCIFFIWLFRPLAVRLDLIDHPVGRKQHAGSIPLIGGIAMYFGFIFAVLTLSISFIDYRSFLAGSSLLIIVGILDDFHEFTARIKFIAQILAVFFMTTWGDVVIRDIGAIIPGRELVLGLGVWAYPFTFIGAMAVINAINMSDGLDGLAAGYVTIALISMLILSISNPSAIYDSQLLLILVSVVVAFLLFNTKMPWRTSAVIFMGDAGSLFLGFVLAWFVISLSQGSEATFNPVTALWFLAIPLFDLVGVILKRFLEGGSVFSADRGHLHHLLKDSGFTSEKTVTILLAIAFAMALIGIIGEVANIPESLMLILFFVLFGLYAIKYILHTKGRDTASYPQSISTNPEDKSFHHQREGVCVAIYGAGESGMKLAQFLLKKSDVQPCFFLDDNESLNSLFIANLPVFSPGTLSDLMTQYDLKEVILAMPSLSVSKRKAIIQTLANFPFRVRSISSIVDLETGENRIDSIQNLSIEAIVGRDEYKADPLLLAKCIEDKNVLVTGAGGTVGSELCRQIVVASPASLILLDWSESKLYKLEKEIALLLRKYNSSCRLISLLASVQNEKQITYIVNKYNVNTLYHSAAHTNIALLEQNPVECLRNNVLGAHFTAKAAQEAGIGHYILTNSAPYDESIIGTSRYLSELSILAFAQRSKNTLFSVVRLSVSNLNLNKIQKQILLGETVTIMHPMCEQFYCSISESILKTIEAGALARGGEIFVIDTGKPIKVYELVKQLISLNGSVLKKDGEPTKGIEVVFSGRVQDNLPLIQWSSDKSFIETKHPSVYKSMKKHLGWDDYLSLYDDLLELIKKEDDKGLLKFLDCLNAYH